MTDDKPYKSLSGVDIRRVFHGQEVVPLEPIKMEIRKVPIDEFMEEMCRICPCGDPQKFFEELAEIPTPPPFDRMERDQSLEGARAQADEDEGVFKKALEKLSEDS